MRRCDATSVLANPLPHEPRRVRPLAFDYDVVQGQDVAARRAVAWRMPMDSIIGVGLIWRRDDVSDGHAVIAGSDIETPDAIFDLGALDPNVEGVSHADVGAAGFRAVAIDRHVVDVLVACRPVRVSDNDAIRLFVGASDIARLRPVARQADEASVEPQRPAQIIRAEIRRKMDGGSAVGRARVDFRRGNGGLSALGDVGRNLRPRTIIRNLDGPEAARRLRVRPGADAGRSGDQDHEQEKIVRFMETPAYLPIGRASPPGGHGLHHRQGRQAMLSPEVGFTKMR